MGEYINQYKIGTCDDLRYIRYEELMKVKIRFPEVNEYISDNKSIFRFPFPLEDNENPIIYRISTRREFTDVIQFTSKQIAWNNDHKKITNVISPRGGGYQIAVQFDCPNDPTIKSTSGFPILIVGERYKNGIPRTIFECGYCGAWFAIDKKHLEIVKEYFQQEHEYEIRKTNESNRCMGYNSKVNDFNLKIIERIHAVDEMEEYVKGINDSGKELNYHCTICGNTIKHGETYYSHPEKDDNDIYHSDCDEMEE